MKIFYSHYLASDEHPAARMVASIARGLERLGHQVRIHRSAPSEPVTGSAKRSGSGKKKSGWKQRIKDRLWFLKALWRNRGFFPRDLEAVKQFQPDILLSRQDAYCYSMVKVAKRTGIPLVTYADAPVAYEVRHFEEGGRWNPPGLVESIERQQLIASQAVITVSQGARRILERYRLEVPIHVVPNGVEAPLLPLPTPAERQNRRSELGVRASRLIGFAGSFKPFHGLDLLATLMEATASRDDCQWVLIGDGPGLDRFRSLATSWKHPPLITGWIATQKVREILQLVDVAVAPHARTKGEFYFCPLKLLDYASGGCAILGSDQGDLPRLLGGAQAGAWVETDSVAIWTEHLFRLLDQPEVTRAMGRLAREQVEAGLTWDHTASQIEKVLKATLSSASK